MIVSKCEVMRMKWDVKREREFLDYRLFITERNEVMEILI